MPEYPYSDHDFFLIVSPQQNSFIADAAGAVVRVVHHQRGRDETLERITAEAAQRFEDARLKRVAEKRAPHTAAQLSFLPGSDGKASAVILHQNGKDQTAPRVDPSPARKAGRTVSAACRNQNRSPAARRLHRSL